MEKLFIKNRGGVKMVVVVDQAENQRGLVFVMHGLSGFKEQPHIQMYGEAFKEEGFTVVWFDTTNTLGSGESGGKYEDATITNYYSDLEDVINWASSQEWYEEPFCLAGHSLGGICTALYAENFPEKVRAVAPTSTVVSGRLSAKTPGHMVKAEEWKRTGWKIEKSNAQPGLIKRLKWSHMEDRLKYDLIPGANKLTMPVLLIVGSEDVGTPEEHQRILFDALPGDKEIHVIDGAGHTFREKGHLAEIRRIFGDWIEDKIL